MENPSSNLPRVNFEFAFNDIDFSDRVLHIEIMADSLDCKSDSEGSRNRKRKREKLDKENECSTDAEVKTLHISSPILAANSPFFYKLFKNGMKESQERDVTLRINESEDLALMELLNFMYNNTLTSTTTSDLLGVLIIADKFEVTSCIAYCSEMLQKMCKSLESSVLYLELPSSILVNELVQPLIEEAKKYLIERYKDIKMPNEEMMPLPLSAIEVILGSYSVSRLVISADDVYEFILKWARSHYPNLQERCEVLTNRLTQFIRFHYMSGPKLKGVPDCPEFDRQEAYKLVNEALLFKIELPYGKHIHSSNKCQTIKVEQFELPKPRCVIFFDMKKEECENLFTSIRLRSSSIHLGGRCFHLEAQCRTKEEQKTFGLFLYMTKESESCTVDYEFAVINKSSKEFQTKEKGNFRNSNLLFGWGYSDILGLPWSDFMSKECEYFLDGVLHLRAYLTVNNAPA